MPTENSSDRYLENEEIIIPLNDEKVFVEGQGLQEFHVPIGKKVLAYSFNKFLSESSTDVEFLRFYVGSNNLEDFLPEHLSESIEASTERLEPFFRSFHRTGIKWRQIGLHKLVPDSILENYYAEKSKAVEHIYRDFEKPNNYGFLEDISMVCSKIAERKLNKNRFNLFHMKGDQDLKKFLKSTKEKNSIKYDIFASKTGRVGLKEGSFPILNMKSEYRPLLEPNHNKFVELDYNAAELRTALALLGKEQPTKDLHTWNRENVFGKSYSREECKKAMFAWLYGNGSSVSELDETYDRKSLLEEYYDGNSVVNPYSREIEVEEDKALSYLIQSSFSDYFLRKVVEVDEHLSDIGGAEIAFFIHDSIILDLREHGFRSIIDDVQGVLEQDDFPVSVSVSDNFGGV